MEPFSDASTAHDVLTGRQAYCKLEKAGFRVHRAATLHADDACLFLVRLDTVVDLKELAKECLGHGVRVDGSWTKDCVDMRN